MIEQGGMVLSFRREGLDWMPSFLGPVSSNWEINSLATFENKQEITGKVWKLWKEQQLCDSPVLFQGEGGHHKEAYLPKSGYYPENSTERMS